MPFVGPAGKLLDRALEEAGIDPASVFRTNVVKHFRFSGTRGKQRIHKSPSRVHVSACEPWLLAEFDVVRPKGVVLLGATAGKAVYGSSFRVGDVRGRLIAWPQSLQEAPVASPGWVLPTTHPSAVLRSRSREEDYTAMVADLAVLLAEDPRHYRLLISGHLGRPLARCAAQGVGPTVVAAAGVVGLWHFSAGGDLYRFLAVDVWVLAALTVPHVAAHTSRAAQRVSTNCLATAVGRVCRLPRHVTDHQVGPSGAPRCWMGRA